MAPLLLFLFLATSANATVTLDSSAVSECPGDTVVFTCATDTGELIWAVGDSKAFFNNISMPMDDLFPTFHLKLISQNGRIFISTATIDNVDLDHNGTAISCSDSAFPQYTTAVETVVVPGPPTTPLKLSFSFDLSSVTISWVAPLDTPLCVHSYTVTVRNSCNSSQVVVYNTTDNRSSLSITDLTSDGEYSVTVAGRDGAGRLGQESEDLNVLLREKKSITNFTSQTVFMSSSTYGVLLSWNYSKQSHFLIHHNVSSDQRSIRIDRPRLTLYGVQQGETYSVKIILLTSAGNYGKNFSFKIAEATSIPNSDEQECPPEWKSENPGSDLSIGYIASILGSAVLMFVITCYLLMCVFTKFYVPGKEACMRDHGDVNPFLLKQPGDEAGIIKEVGAAAEGVEENTTQSVPEYDYVCHQ